jgi:hypothetical protein
MRGVSSFELRAVLFRLTKWAVRVIDGYGPGWVRIEATAGQRPRLAALLNVHAPIRNPGPRASHARRDGSEARDTQRDPHDRPPPRETAGETPAPCGGDAHAPTLARTGDATCIATHLRHATRLPFRPRDDAVHVDGRRPPNAGIRYPSTRVSKHVLRSTASKDTSGAILGAVTGILILSAVLALGGVVVWIVLLLWAAREDGRDQDRRDELRGH